MKRLTYVTVAALTSILVSCQQRTEPSTEIGSDSAAVRAMTLNEREQDFDSLIQLFENHYAPYDFKERTLGIRISDIATGLRPRAVHAQSDEEFLGILREFAAVLRDGHVSLRPTVTSSNIKEFKIPMLITPVEDKALVASVNDEIKKTFQIEVGDEVVEIDEKAPFAYLPTLSKYESFANDISDRHLIYQLFFRKSYMTDLVPRSPFINVKIRKAASGEVLVKTLPWTIEKYAPAKDSVAAIQDTWKRVVPAAEDYNRVTKNIDQWGSPTPFFFNPKANERFKFKRLTLSKEIRKEFELSENDKEVPEIFAALYKHKGKVILLIRQPSYSPEEEITAKTYLNTYMALLKENESLADVLVVDQTHNTGGSYCNDFYEIFTREGDVQEMDLLRADKAWIERLQSQAREKNLKSIQFAAFSEMVEAAFNAGQRLSNPVPYTTEAYSYFAQTKKFNWKKPMLVLTDELAASCGDVFPMLVKANKRAKIFGQRTMGLGGIIQKMGTLMHSRVSVSMTRSLFFAHNPNSPTPSDRDFAENNGVQPDIPHTITVKDFRQGFTDYIEAFSDRAVEQIIAN